ncbi:hypothetical protein ACP4OV_010115 [Aristida adscensionis]
MATLAYPVATAGAGGGGAARAKNRNPAPVQITAEQLLREAREGGDPELLPPPRRTIADAEELAEHRLRRRGEFEALVRRAGAAEWVRYARWEEAQGDVPRARSVLERALDAASHRDPALWARYAELEARAGCAARARAVWDRAVAALPRVDRLWRGYAAAEERLSGDAAAARRVLERWAAWRPAGTAASEAHAGVDLRHGETARARAGGTEDAAATRRRRQYEHAVAGDPLDYDLWFDYLRFEEGTGDVDRVRAVYERAVAHVPPAEEKRHWRRYIYLWISRDLYEELDAQDMDKARAVYRDCLRLIPHAKFSFSKVWIMAAQFEVRQKNLAAARRILGNAIGVAPKEKVFSMYIGMELRLGCVACARTLCEKFIEWAPGNSRAWLTYAELEKSLGEAERERAIRQLAINSVETKAAEGGKRKRPMPCVPSNARIRGC